MFLRAAKLLLGVSLFVLLFSACSLFKKDPPHALNWKVPDFSYKDESNQSFGLKDLKGKVWIADFVFTHCTSVCPIETSQMALLQKKLKLAKVIISPRFSTNRYDCTKRMGCQDKSFWHI